MATQAEVSTAQALYALGELRSKMNSTLELPKKIWLELSYQARTLRNICSDLANANLNAKGSYLDRVTLETFEGHERSFYVVLTSFGPQFWSYDLIEPWSYRDKQLFYGSLANLLEHFGKQSLSLGKVKPEWLESYKLPAEEQAILLHGMKFVKDVDV